MSDVLEKSAIERERDAFIEERDTLLAEINKMDQDRKAKSDRISEIKRRMKAHDAYARTLRESAAKSNAAPRGSRREAIVDALGATANGMTRGEMLERFGVKGDRSGEFSISNALTALQKAGQVTRTDEGRWMIVAGQMRQAAE